jgi:hypothetical protein
LRLGEQNTVGGASATCNEEQADDERKDLQDSAFNAGAQRPPWHGTLEQNSIAAIEEVAVA